MAREAGETIGGPERMGRHDQDEQDDDPRTDRRGRIKVVGAGAAAAVIGTVVATDGAGAAPGDPWVLGTYSFAENNRTRLFSSHSLAVQVVTDSTDPTATALSGVAPVLGLRGFGGTTGVHGTGPTGVKGDADAIGGVGVSGLSGEEGQCGVSGDATQTSAAGTGVLGQGNSVGVRGVATGSAGTGVSGGGPTCFMATSVASGTTGFSADLPASSLGSTGAVLRTLGIYGIALKTESNATLGTAITAKAKVAINATGQIKSNQSGLATVAANASSVMVTSSALGLSASTSKILATPQTFVSGLSVAACVVNNATSFRIHLSSTPTVAVKVAWWVLS